MLTVIARARRWVRYRRRFRRLIVSKQVAGYGISAAGREALREQARREAGYDAS